MERKKRSKGSVWELCYANKIFGTFGDEIKACGQKLVKFCTHAAKLVVEIKPNGLSAVLEESGHDYWYAIKAVNGLFYGCKAGYSILQLSYM